MNLSDSKKKLAIAGYEWFCQSHTQPLLYRGDVFLMFVHVK